MMQHEKSEKSVHGPYLTAMIRVETSVKDVYQGPENQTPSRCSGDLLYERIALQIMALNKDHFRNKPIREQALASLTLDTGVRFVSFLGWENRFRRDSTSATQHINSERV